MILSEVKPNRRIVVAGSTGFIGRRLVQLLKDWTITTLDRTPSQMPGIEALQWDGATLGDWVKKLDGADAVINLAGSPVAVKWDEENKERIQASRVNSTLAIGRALSALANPPQVWVNGSATGFYGDRGDTVLYETSEAGEGFLSDVCRRWEAAAIETAPKLTRLILMRTGFPLGRDGGAFKPLKKVAQFGLGGSAGSGNQWIPWIHLDDLCRMFIWAIENDRVSGPFNGSAPNPVRNRDFMAKLRKELHRPWSPPAPSFALKILSDLSGPNAALLLGSVRAMPRAAIDHGFTWNYPNIGEALHNLSHGSEQGAFVA